MRKISNKITKLGLVTFLLLLISMPAVAAEETFNVLIDRASESRVPIAIPYFMVTDGGGQAQAIAKEFNDFLVFCLDFPGYFKVLDKKAFLFDASKDGVEQERINYQNWRAVGAELLVTGAISVNGNNVQIDLRLFDTFQNTRLVGKRYNGTVNDKRALIQKFCEEVMLALIDNKGVYNTRIAFVSADKGVKDIYMCEFDGFGATRVTNDSSITIFPAWSKDGRYLSYTTYKNRKTDMVIRDMSTGREMLVDKKGTTIKGGWMPTENMVAASFSFSGNQNIYLLNTRGGFGETLVEGGGANLSPTWSPDGSKLAFVSSRSGGPQIYVLDRATKKISRVTFEGKYNSQPNWSPRGDRIAYSSMVGGYHQICLTDPEGSFTMQLTNSAGDNECASWSPDGSMIVFSSTREGAAKLYVMTAFGANQRRLMSIGGEQISPAWSLHHVE